MIYVIVLLFFIKIKVNLTNINPKEKVSISFLKRFIYFKKPKTNNFHDVKKALNKAVSFKNLFMLMLKKTIIKKIEVNNYHLLNADLYNSYLYISKMETIKAVSDFLNYYSQGVREEKYRNNIMLEGKSKIQFSCIFQIRLGNIIIVILRYLGGIIYGKTIGRNA